jgi:hypothetical protein
MPGNKDHSELLINRLLDGELPPHEELELNRTLIRDPELVQLRDDYRRIDEHAGSALCTLRGGSVSLGAIFDADRAPIRMTPRVRRGWVMIPGAIAAAWLALVIPGPDFGGRPTESPIVVDGRDLYPVDATGGWSGEAVRTPVSTSVPRIRSQTGRDVIGVVGDDGNLYWIEVEKKRTVRWPAGSAQSDPRDSF